MYFLYFVLVSLSEEVPLYFNIMTEHAAINAAIIIEYSKEL